MHLFLEGMDIKKQAGYPIPLGATQQENGVNFALFSQHAVKVILCLFSPGASKPFSEITLDPEEHKTGWIWHILLKDLPPFVEYGYKITGPMDDSCSTTKFSPETVLLDPYAKGLNTSHEWGQPPSETLRGRIILETPFDWGDDRPLRHRMEEVILYEMHVRSFTQHPSSGVKNRGTFLGIIEKIPHLKSLGVNAIELMPIFEFDEWGLHHLNSNAKTVLTNVWGYSPISFFCPMNRYATSSDWTTALDEFRLLVKQMHLNGIEVYLDVVYNHTAEGNEKGPLYSFRGIDDPIYYLLNPDGSYSNYSGTGNTLNANHVVVKQLILASLRYWVSEMHVDGFRFDLASCLTRDEQGSPLLTPPLIQAIIHDPVLANTKLIAEAWDAAGLYQVGSFPGEGRFAEWNGKYRDHVRRFIKGSKGESGAFAQCLSGSQNLYGKWKTPHLSINFVTAHDGFSLRDLVSYQEKHNEANQENNEDGTNQNDSDNYGEEGPTHNPEILALRERQMRNFHTALMVSIGVPMLLMGDEYGHTRKGNNNPYAQDNELNWFLWNEIKKNAGFFRFYKQLIQFRKDHPCFCRDQFLTDKDIQWHGKLPLKPNWEEDNHFVAYTLYDLENHPALYIAFNSEQEKVVIHLPPPPKGKRWFRVVDTSFPSPNDYFEQPQTQEPLIDTYEMMSHSSLIAKLFS